MRRIDLVQKMQKQGLDFRLLNNFKQLLFTEHKGDASTEMPLTEFQRIKNMCAHQEIKNGFCGLESEILDQVCTNDLVDMGEFCGLVDLCIYIPKKQEKRTGKMSPDIFRILSSNQ